MAEGRTRGQSSHRKERARVADMAYLLLIVGSFVVLAALLRGLERL
ncbi:MAG: hypothetical protein ACRDS0_18290 [Pseudonocardiaceae bacterium]